MRLFDLVQAWNLCGMVVFEIFLSVSYSDYDVVYIDYELCVFMRSKDA